MITFNTRVNLNTAKLQQKAEVATYAAQMQLDQDVMKDSNYYIPKDTGNLEQSSVRASLIGEGTLYWDTPYAKKLYYNARNLSKDKNPNASNLWFEKAKASKKAGWLKAMKTQYKQHFDRK